MLRDDWWWPWWISSLIDLGVVAVAAAALVFSRRRAIRLIAGMLVLAGLVAAVLAPIVMTDESDEPSMDMGR
jgi:hypothetical protein